MARPYRASDPCFSSPRRRLRLEVGAGSCSSPVMRRRAIVVVAGLLAGCSIFTDLSKFDRGGTDAGASEDGALPPPAVDAGEAGAPLGCARYADASFCADFDGVDPVGPSVWTEVLTAPAGDIVTTGESTVSPPLAMRVDVERPGCAFVNLSRLIRGVYQRVTARAAIFGREGAGALSLTLYPGDGTEHNVVVMVEEQAVVLVVQRFAGGQVTNFVFERTPLPRSTRGAWSTLELTLETAPRRRVAVRILGVEVEEALEEEIALRDPELGVGSWCADEVTSALFDDVAVWLER